MPIQTLIIIISWATFLLFWAILAFNVKKDSQRGPRSLFWSKRVVIARFIILALVIVVALGNGHRFNTVGNISRAQYLPTGPLLATIGAMLVVLGVALAIWSRIYLGRNWSSYPTLKESHELITSGPYRLIRHPIYTGVLLGVLGSGLAGGLWWLIPFFFGCFVFVRRVFKEEKIMTKEFPDQYPDYKKHTWALIPYVW